MGWAFARVRQAGDINGDGVADIIVVARFGDNSAINAGESYVIFGGASVGSAGAVDLSRLSGSDGFVINGDSANDRSGTSVSGAVISMATALTTSSSVRRGMAAKAASTPVRPSSYSAAPRLARVSTCRP